MVVTPDLWKDALAAIERKIGLPLDWGSASEHGSGDDSRLRYPPLEHRGPIHIHVAYFRQFSGKGEESWIASNPAAVVAGGDLVWGQWESVCVGGRSGDSIVS